MMLRTVLLHLHMYSNNETQYYAATLRTVQQYVTYGTRTLNSAQQYR